MIVSGGENVFPREVEDLLAAHEAIDEVAVVGVEDEQFGQRLRAFVVLREGADLDAEARQGATSRRTSRATRCRARSSSSTSCRATRPARSSSASCRRTERLAPTGAGPTWEAWRPGPTCSISGGCGSRRARPGAWSSRCPWASSSFGGQRYVPSRRRGPARLDVTRMTGGGYSLRLRFAAALDRPVHALPGAGRARRRRSTPARSTSPAAARSCRARTSTARSSTWRRGRTTRSRSACPSSSLCRDDCAGLCPECGADLNAAGARAPPRDRARPALGQAARAQVRVAAADARARRPRDPAPATRRWARRARTGPTSPRRNTGPVGRERRPASSSTRQRPLLARGEEVDRHASRPGRRVRRRRPRARAARPPRRGRQQRPTRPVACRRAKARSSRTSRRAPWRSDEGRSRAWPAPRTARPIASATASAAGARVLHAGGRVRDAAPRSRMPAAATRGVEVEAGARVAAHRGRVARRRG